MKATKRIFFLVFFFATVYANGAAINDWFAICDNYKVAANYSNPIPFYAVTPDYTICIEGQLQQAALDDVTSYISLLRYAVGNTPITLTSTNLNLLQSYTLTLSIDGNNY